jgi:lipoyl(octanoyl) transferase
LDPYDTIIACGIRDAKTSTLSQLLGKEISPAMAAEVVQKHLNQIGKVTL